MGVEYQTLLNVIKFVADRNLKMFDPELTWMELGMDRQDLDDIARSIADLFKPFGFVDLETIQRFNTPSAFSRYLSSFSSNCDNIGEGENLSRANLGDLAHVSQQSFRSDSVEFELKSVMRHGEFLPLRMHGVDKCYPWARPQIHIVALGNRFPGGSNSAAQYWEMLKGGFHGISDLIGRKFISEPCGFMSVQIESFDAFFFAMSSIEAKNIDPQHRLCLEVLWEMFEAKGIDANSLLGTQCSVLIGQCNNDYNELASYYRLQSETYSYVGNNSSFAGGRLSHFFGFQGPSLVVNTGCSSSLVALHQAYESLINNANQQLAIAGAVNVLLSPIAHRGLRETGALTITGTVKAFDAHADGYVRAEGCAMLLLSNDTQQAIATIKAIGMNHDGLKANLTVPNGDAQRKLSQEQLCKAELSANELDCFECHGTGTVVGDPIEVDALNAALSNKLRALQISSAKTVIGHLESAAGMAGIIKCVAAMTHNYQPSHLHFSVLNTKIMRNKSNIYTTVVGGEVMENPCSGVNSFALSGTNACAIISKGDFTVSQKCQIQSQDPYNMLTLSAKTNTALANQAHAIMNFLLCSNEGFEAIAHHSNRVSVHFQHRTAVVARNAKFASEKLKKKIDCPSRLNEWMGFVFSQKSNDIGWAGKELYKTRQPFQYTIDKSRSLSNSLLELYDKKTPNSKLQLLSIQCALLHLWSSLGIECSHVMGLGWGELPALYAAGVIEFEHVFSIANIRQRLMENYAAIRVSAECKRQISVVTDVLPCDLASNGDAGTIVFGKSDNIREIKIFLTFLAHNVYEVKDADAYFSKHVNEEFRTELQSVPLKIPKKHFVSSATGNQLMAVDYNYLSSNINKHKCFGQLPITHLIDNGVESFIEHCINPVNLPYAHKLTTYSGQSIWWMTSLKPNKSELKLTLTVLSDLYVRGKSVLLQHDHHLIIESYPTYKFDRQHYWLTDDMDMAKHCTDDQAPVSSCKITVPELIQSVIPMPDDVSPDTRLTKLGMNSLLATQYSKKLTRHGYSDISAQWLIGATVQALRDKLGEKQPTIIEPAPPLLRADRQSIDLELSSGQTRLWLLHQQYEGQNYSYNEQIILKLRGELNVNVYQEVMMHIAQEQTSLRTKCANLKPKLMVLSMSESSYNVMVTVSRDSLTKTISVLRRKPFDFSKGPLNRTQLLGRGNKNHVINIVQHHIIMDAYSTSMLMKNLSHYYEKIINAGKHIPVKFKTSAVDFAALERTKLEENKSKDIVAEWQSRLNGHDMTTELPYDHRPTLFQNQNGINKHFNLSTNFSEWLQIEASKVATTEFVLLLGRFQTALFQFCWQDATTIAVPYANRTTDIEKLMGFFVSTVLLPLSRHDQSIQTLQFLVHQALEDVMLFEKILPLMMSSSFPNVMVMYANQDFSLNLPQIAAEYLQLEDISKTDWHIWMHKLNGQHRCSLIYRQKMFYAKTIDTFLKTFFKTLDKLTEIGGDHCNYCIRKETCNTMRSTSHARMLDSPIHFSMNAMFEQQTKTTATRCICLSDATCVSYEAMKHYGCIRSSIASQAVHNKFNSGSANPDSVFTLIADNNIEILSDIITCNMSGAAYMPVDNSFPRERIAFMLSDAAAKLIVTIEHFTESYDVSGINLRSVTSHLKNQKVYPKAMCSDLAYVIYTSGTTGKPKGVTIAHRKMGTLIQCATVEYLLLNSDSCQLQLYKFTFDTSLIDIMGTISNGACLQLSQNMTDNALRNLSTFKSVTTFGATPALISSMSLTQLKQLDMLETVWYAGEQMEQKTMDHLIEQSCIIIQGYGPTETTVEVTFKRMKLCDSTNNLGHGRLGCLLYVVGPDSARRPHGGMGQLICSGDCLTRGYVNRPEDNKAKLITNDYTSERSEMLSLCYKTGDLVRQAPDKMFRIYGRIDFQVKIRGFRIELEEVESCLNAVPGVHTCTVWTEKLTDANYKTLVAFYVAAPDVQTSTVELECNMRFHLKNNLATYMIPGIFILVDKIPLTINGKIDRASLHDVFTAFRQRPQNPQQISKKEPNCTKSYTNVKNDEVEQVVAQVWRSVLNTSHSDINDDFFHVGGDSISVSILANNLSEILNIKISPGTIIDNPSIKTITNWVKSRGEVNVSSHSIVASPSTNTKLVVIGMSGLFSGCSDTNEFWENIKEGKECIDTFNLDESPSRLSGYPDYVPSSGTISSCKYFEYGFWNIAQRKACFMDPQRRKMLEQCLYALENSGQTHEQRISVFAGCGDNEYTKLIYDEDGDVYENWSIKAMESTAAAALVSFHLDLIGRSIDVNAGCSTGLVVITQAHDGSDIVLATCSNFPLPENYGYRHAPRLIFSKDGHCRPFDKNADGTIPGAAVGAMVLKNIAKLVQTDRVLAIIEGFAANNDGNVKSSFYSPSTRGQIECIKEAHKMTDLKKEQFIYIECHGTGTLIGDSVEVDALSQAFTYVYGQPDQISIGSVKANIGHAYQAAGISGIFKLCKVLKDQVVPPQINFETLNPDLINAFDRGHFSINCSKKSRALSYRSFVSGAVSAFGIGGANAHIVLSCSATYNMAQTSNADGLFILPISAKTEISCKKYVKVLDEFLMRNSDSKLADIAFSLHSRQQFCTRTSLVCDCVTQAHALLNSSSRLTFHSSKAKPNTILMCSPTGQHYVEMAKDLYKISQPFAKLIDKCFDMICEQTGYDMRHYFYPENGISNEALDCIELTQPAQMCYSYCLGKFLNLIGVEGDSLCGHSAGELCAVALADALSMKDFVTAVTIRAKLLSQISKSSMLLVEANEDQIQEYLEMFSIEVAAVNTPTCVVLSGSTECIMALDEELRKQNIGTHVLNINHAAHSRFVEPQVKRLIAEFEQLNFKHPNREVTSSVTNNVIGDVNATYWGRHLRATVQFWRTVCRINKCYAKPFFVELGPGNTLCSYVKAYDPQPLVRSTMLSKAMAYNTKDWMFFETIGLLWCNRVDVTWHTVFTGNSIQMPNYQFDQIECWLNTNLMAENNRNDFAQLAIKPAKSSESLSSHESEDNIHLINCALNKVFKRVLGKILVDDKSFSEMGGNSVNAINAIHLLQTNHNITVSINELMNRPLNQLSNFLIESEQSFDDPLVFWSEFQKNKPTVVLVHPVGGTVELYRPIVEALPKGFNYIGIQYPETLMHNLNYDTVNLLAKYYVEQLLSRNEIESPGIILAGASMGGTICFEMAEYIQSQHIARVRCVVMMDSWAKLEFEDKLRENLPNYLFGEEIAEPEAVQQMVEKANWLLDLLLAYKPRVGDTPTFLLKATETDGIHEPHEESPTLYWERLTNQLEVWPVRGTHMGIVKTGCVVPLLKEILNHYK